MVLYIAVGRLGRGRVGSEEEILRDVFRGEEQLLFVVEIKERRKTSTIHPSLLHYPPQPRVANDGAAHLQQDVVFGEGRACDKVGRGCFSAGVDGYIEKIAGVCDKEVRTVLVGLSYLALVTPFLGADGLEVLLLSTLHSLSNYINQFGMA